MQNFGQSLASVIFTLYLFLSLPAYAVISLLTAPFPHRVTYAVGRHWVKTVLFLLKMRPSEEQSALWFIISTGTLGERTKVQPDEHRCTS